MTLEDLRTRRATGLNHAWHIAILAARNTGPSTRPKKPKESNPPKTPKNTSASGRLVPRLMSKGFKKLSTEETASTPQMQRKMASPGEPVAKSQSATGNHTKGGPMGTSDKTHTAKESRTTPGASTMIKPMAATKPCPIAVPITPKTTERVVFKRMELNSSASPPRNLIEQALDVDRQKLPVAVKEKGNKCDKQNLQESVSDTERHGNQPRRHGIDGCLKN